MGTYTIDRPSTSERQRAAAAVATQGISVSSADARIVFSCSPRYVFHRVLGSGAYGMVASARDMLTGLPVAIKRIHQISTVLVARRTLRELRMLRHFQGHPNIIGITDLFGATEDLGGSRRPEEFVGDDGSESNPFEELFITQELMDCDLCQIISGNVSLVDSRSISSNAAGTGGLPPISESHIRGIMWQLLSGLAAIHASNVVHRDLKPGNILWSRRGDVKICDFGLARALPVDRSYDSASSTSSLSLDLSGSTEALLAEEDDHADLTMTNYVATRWYRPPELLLQRHGYGKALDIWSVGCIFAELLLRRVFLPGDSSLEQLRLILTRVGVPDRGYIERIPDRATREFILRYANAQQQGNPPLRSMLDTHFGHVSVAAQDLLRWMLQFDPDRRCSVQEALWHPWFDGLPREYTLAISSTREPFYFKYDRDNLSLDDLKYLIREDIREYRMSRDAAANAYLYCSGLPSSSSVLSGTAGMRPPVAVPIITYDPLPSSSSLLPAISGNITTKAVASGLIGKARKFLLNASKSVDDLATVSADGKIILPIPLPSNTPKDHR